MVSVIGSVSVGAASFQIGSSWVGRGRCFIIAEVGVNHNGDVELAHRLIDEIADAGADAVKFQTFVPELLASQSAERAEYQKRNTGEDTSQLEMLRRLVLPAEAHMALMDHAQRRKLVFLSTPFDLQSVELLLQLPVPAWKISSGDLTNLPFLARIASNGLPMLVSTGMATIEEVDVAVATIRAASPGLQFGLFHCVSDYPTAPQDCNLRVMDAMRTRYGCPVGWSDHTQGIAVSIAAVAMGAEILEKHITLDRDLPGPDHRASLEPEEFAAMVRGIREAEAARGDGEKKPLPHELQTAMLARKSIVSIRAIAQGELLEASNIDIRRPGTGLPPAQWSQVLGARAARAIGAGVPLRADDVNGTGEEL